MLSQEAAQERLKQFRKTAWTKQARARVGRLPEPDAQATRALGFEKRGGRDWEKRRQRVIDAARHLDKMSVKARTAAFAALFPKLAEEMERCWQRMTRCCAGAQRSCSSQCSWAIDRISFCRTKSR